MWEFFEYLEFFILVCIMVGFLVLLIVVFVMMFCVEILFDFEGIQCVNIIREFENGMIVEIQILNFFYLLFIIEFICIVWFVIEFIV